MDHNSVNSTDLINHLRIENWVQFKDILSFLCLAVTVVVFIRREKNW